MFHNGVVAPTIVLVFRRRILKKNWNGFRKKYMNLIKGQESMPCSERLRSSIYVACPKEDLRMI